MDLLDFIAEAELKEKISVGINLNPKELQVGNIVRFEGYDKKLVEGIFVTRGFWDGRDKETPTYYFVLVNECYREFNPHIVRWSKIGHNPEYEPPRKDEITSELILLLKNTKFVNRIKAYQNFQRRYPFLSCEYHPYVSRAWKEAIVEITTEQEVLDNISYWSYQTKLPGFVRELLMKHLFPLPPDERFQKLLKLKFVEETVRTRKHVGCWQEKQYTYWEPVLRKFIQETSSQEAFCHFCRLWGIQGYFTDDPVPGMAWIEGNEVIIPI